MRRVRRKFGRVPNGRTHLEGSRISLPLPLLIRAWSYRVSHEIAPHLPLYYLAEKELTHVQISAQRRRLKFYHRLRDGVFFFINRARTFRCFGFNSNSNLDNKSRCRRMLRKNRDRFQIIVKWACCRLDHNTKAIVWRKRMSVSFYSRAGTGQPTFMGRTLNFNCFDLLYLFRRIGRFDELGWANEQPRREQFR